MDLTTATTHTTNDVWLPAAAEPIAAQKVQFLPTGLVIADDISWEEWVHLGGTLSTMEVALHWWLGDRINRGEALFGEKYAQAVQETGRNYQSLVDIAYVAGRVELSRRRDNLTFSHHREVAPLPPAEQDRLLDLAESEGLTIKALRALAREARGLPAPAAPAADTLRASSPEEEDGAEEFDAVAEWQRAEAEAAALREVVEASDLGAELLAARERYAALESRLRAANAEKAEAVKRVKWYQRRFSMLAEALGVEEREVVEAVRALAVVR